MNRKRLLLLSRICLAGFFLFSAGLTIVWFIAATRNSYSIARRLERESDRIIRKWERGVGEPGEQAHWFRHWGDAPADVQDRIFACAPYGVDLDVLQADQPFALLLHRPRATGERSRAVNGRGDRWGWYLAACDAIHKPRILWRGRMTLVWGLIAWLWFRILPPDDDRDDDVQPWEPPPRWPGRILRPVGGGRSAAPLVHGWN